MLPARIFIKCLQSGPALKAILLTIMCSRWVFDITSLIKRTLLIAAADCFVKTNAHSLLAAYMMRLVNFSLDILIYNIYACTENETPKTNRVQFMMETAYS